MNMRMLILPCAVLLLAAVVAPVDAQAQDFDWSGAIAPGATLEVRGVNGPVRAVASRDGTARVEAVRTARRSDPQSVRIEVVEHAGGVTVCAVYPGAGGGAAANRCQPGGGRNNVQDNDVRVEFTVQVPAGVNFSGHTVNGEIEAHDLRSDVTVGTVNGGVSVRTTGFVSRATTVNGSIVLEVPAGLGAELHASVVNGSIDTDFPIRVVGRTSRRAMRGTIGDGGPELRVSTVNGSIRLREI